MTRIAGILDEPIAHMVISASAEGAFVADERRFTLQAKDRLRDNFIGRYAVLLWISDTQWGPPAAATGSTWQTGTVVETILANAAWVALTDSSGTLVVDINIIGGATKFMQAAVLAIVEASAGFAWS